MAALVMFMIGRNPTFRGTTANATLGPEALMQARKGTIVLDRAHIITTIPHPEFTIVTTPLLTTELLFEFHSEFLYYHTPASHLSIFTFIMSLSTYLPTSPSRGTMLTLPDYLLLATAADLHSLLST
jgi:hypothetical protein